MIPAKVILLEFSDDERLIGVLPSSHLPKNGIKCRNVRGIADIEFLFNENWNFHFL
jgi:hypothetical protein